MPLNILCLHGFRQNAKSFRAKTAVLRKELERGDLCKLHFADAPFVRNPETGELLALEAAPQANGVAESEERSWWDSVALPHEGGTYKYKGFEEHALPALLALARETKFDGILGFSQGATLAATLVALKDPNALTAGLRFVILVSGFPPRDPALWDVPESKLPLPSLHILGQDDQLVPNEASEVLKEAFCDPEILSHSRGHLVPSASYERTIIRQFVAKYA